MIKQIREWLRELQKPMPIPKLRRFLVVCEDGTHVMTEAHFVEDRDGPVKFYRYFEEDYPRKISEVRRWREWRDITEESRA
jgi:hypothetical protein